MSQTTFTDVLRRLLPLLLIAVTGTSIAHEPATGWRTECVGRMQLSLPGDAEIATNSARTMEAEYKVVGQQPPFEFPDGEVAGWSSIHYSGRVLVSHRLGPRDVRTLERAWIDDAEQSKRWAKNKASSTGERLVFEALSVAPKRGIATRVNAAYDVSLLIDDRIIRQSSSGQGMGWPDQMTQFHTFATGAVARSYGDIPNRPGICLPYFFVGDDGRPARSIGTTYRLTNHPDITVWLEDASALERSSDQIEAKLEPRAKSDFFWSNYDSSSRQSLRSEWSPSYRNVSFAETKAVESFVKIVRKDSSVDFGYLVAGRGDSKAKPDASDLMLYVIQNAKAARDKGIEPLRRDAFIELAQAIAASVKRRPTTP